MGLGKSGTAWLTLYKETRLMDTGEAVDVVYLDFG